MIWFWMLADILSTIFWIVSAYGEKYDAAAFGFIAMWYCESKRAMLIDAAEPDNTREQP